MTDESPKVLIEEVPTICIVGDPGAGKTRLASLFPDAYCLDAEKGAASAFPPDHRVKFEIEDGMLAKTRAEVQKLSKLPYHDRHLWLGDVPIGAVVLDSIDAVQQVLKYRILGSKKTPSWAITPAMEQRDWGALLDAMVPLIFDLKKLPIPQIVICHVKVTEPLFDDKGEALKKRGYRGIAAQGALEDQMKRWFDYILHLMVGTDSGRMCFTQPTLFEGYSITAKDRHQTFKKLGKTQFPIVADEHGFPKTQAMQAIYDAHAY